jgi:HEPN domain-containing protein
MDKRILEWLKQADYDMDTAEFMAKGGRHFYAERGRAIARLSEASVATRYPDDIDRLQGMYTHEIAAQILTQAKEIVEWIKQQF